MRTRSASLWLAAAFTLLGTGTAAAQQAPRALEFGGDLLAAYSFTSGGVRSSGVALPAGVVRMGIQVSERLSLEPSVNLSRSKTGDGDAATVYFLSGAALYSIHPANERFQPFVGPYLGVSGSASGAASDSSLLYGASAGIRFIAGERVHYRASLNYDRAFENGADNDYLGLKAGVGYRVR
jgi:hypothetical protein